MDRKNTHIEELTPKYYEYDRLHPVIELFLSRMNELNYRYYASELLRSISGTAESDLYASMRRAIAILRLTGVPVQNHFLRVYRCAGPSKVRQDWKLSELACSLIILSYESPDTEIEKFRQAIIHYLGV